VLFSCSEKSPQCDPVERVDGLHTPWFVWVGFSLFILVLLLIDLGVFHRKPHTVSIGEAAAWAAVWIGLGLAFNVLVYFWRGPTQGLEFLTGFIIEKTLSVDNMFVFVMIFTYFAVPAEYQHRVLFWGIVGALIMRAVFIAVGAALLAAFHWVIYVFGGFLVVTGVRMAFHQRSEADPARNPVLRLARRFLPVTTGWRGARFFVKEKGRFFTTPLFMVLLMVESTDLVFAVDSIPAIFAVTDDPFIVYTSNVFAILGLRSLYFLLAGVVERFRYLKLGLSVVLVFVGIKMLISGFYKIPITVSLAVVFVVLAISIIASFLVRPGQTTERTLYCR